MICFLHMIMSKKKRLAIAWIDSNNFHKEDIWALMAVNSLTGHRLDSAQSESNSNIVVNTHTSS